MHVIAAKAQCFYEALQPEFKEYQKQVIKNMKAMSDYLKSKGVKVISDGTDNHLILVDVKSSFDLSGKKAEKILDEIHITCNKNTIPFDTESPFITSGIRIGSPAMTTRGLKEEEFKLIGEIIYKSLSNVDDKDIQKECKKEVLELTKKFTIYKKK